MKNLKLAVALCASLVAFVCSAAAQSGLRQIPLGFCSLSSMSAATGFSSCTMSTFTGTGNGTSLTISSVAGSLFSGEILSGTGVPSGTFVVSQSSGPTGGAGVYVTSQPTTSNAASITASGLPTGITYAVICAYVQGVVYKDDPNGTAPTGTPGSGGQGISAGQCIPYNGTFSALQFIQQTSGAILGASFYR
jgi:hypothetical protein